MAKDKEPEFKEIYAPKHWKSEEKIAIPTKRKKADPNDPIFDHTAFMQNYPFDYIETDEIVDDED